jgi:hypothetical protein
MSRAFDFHDIFERAQHDWLPRPRVETAILGPMQRTVAGCCIVTGEPGSGKTALAAQLIREHGCLHHFLRAGHTDFELWCDPHAFLTSVGFQLLERFGEEIFPPAVAIDVESRVRDVGEGGSVVGAEIGRLVALPWRGAELRVKLDAERVQGKASGVRIAELVEDYRRIPLPTFREMALIDPLRRLARLKPGVRVVLWIDGLDEQPVVAGSTAVADVLLNGDELRALGNFFLVLSSRPGSFLDRFVASGASRIDLDDTAFAQDNAEVAARYVERELARAECITRIGEAGATPDRVRGAVLDACANNFLYLRQFFEAVAEGELPMLLEGGLPPGLDGIYQRLLGRLVANSGDHFSTEVHPLLATLAVAACALQVDRLARFTGLDLNAVKQVLARLRPLLDAVRLADGGTAYGLYHGSFAECICDPRHRDELWHVDAAQAHGRIARQLLAQWHADPESFDDYGIDHLTRHLARAESGQRRALIELMGPAWRRAKRRHHGGHAVFAADLGTAAEVAIALPFPDSVIAVATLALMHTQLAEVATAVPSGAIETMVRIGQLQRALDMLQPELDVDAQLRVIAELLRGLAATGAAGTPLFVQLLQRGLDVCARGGEQTDRLLATLLDACQAGDDRRIEPALQRAVEVFNASPQRSWETPHALRELARLFGPLNRESADHMFEQALKAIGQLALSSEPMQLRELLAHWSKHDLDVAAQALSGHALRPVAYSAAAVAEVARALMRHGRADAAAAVRRQLRDGLLPLFTDSYERACGFAHAAQLEAEAGDGTAAAALLSEARRSAGTIGGADDPDNANQLRPGQATDALILIAQAALAAEPPAAAADLDAAWASLEQRGHWRGQRSLEDLVHAQWKQRPELLEPRLSHLATPELLIAAARLRIIDAPREAADWMEQAIMLSESPDSTAGRDELLLQAARTTAGSDREQAATWVAHANLDSEAETDWRLTVLRSMISAADPAAVAWLDETAQRWLDRASDPNVVSEFAAALRELPAVWIARLADLPQQVEGPKGRLLAAALGPLLPDRSAVLRERLLRPSDDAAGGALRHIPLYQLLAFGAGQWWNADRAFADHLLQQALLDLDAAFSDPEWRGSRDTHVTGVARELARGSAAAALPLLLAHLDAPPQPNVLHLVVDGPLVPALEASGLSRRDALLADALARLAAQSLPVQQALTKLQPPALRSAANAAAAKQASDARADLRLQWCEAALTVAREETSHHLSCLLAAGAAEAWWALGAKRKALEIALDTAHDVLDHGEAFESVMRSAAYPHALGIALCIVAELGEVGSAADLLWQARCLGRGLRRTIGYLMPAIEAARPGAVRELLAGDTCAAALFGPS